MTRYLWSLLVMATGCAPAAGGDRRAAIDPPPSASAPGAWPVPTAPTASAAPRLDGLVAPLTGCRKPERASSSPWSPTVDQVAAVVGVLPEAVCFPTAGRVEAYRRCADAAGSPLPTFDMNIREGLDCTTNMRAVEGAGRRFVALDLTYVRGGMVDGGVMVAEVLPGGPRPYCFFVQGGDDPCVDSSKPNATAAPPDFASLTKALQDALLSAR